MTELDATAPVRFHALPTGCGRRIGVATLDAPTSLNALSLPMVRLLAQRLAHWVADPQTVAIVLQAAGPKAFCAGGDLRALYPALSAANASADPLPRAFFSEEYTLDHDLHTCPKPVLCWGHGIVMGGGMGLMQGASHRVVTPDSRLAMPEISIGLFPDVGGNRFLRRMPGRMGLFAALTGAVMTAGDAARGGLADHVIANPSKADLFESLSSTRWHEDSRVNGAQLSGILRAHAVPEIPASPLLDAAPEIETLLSGGDIVAISGSLQARIGDDPIGRAARTFAAGSPASAALIHAMWQHTQGWALADVLRLDYDVALDCCDQPDLREGIRAVLVDKDRQPAWSPRRIGDVDTLAIRNRLTRPRATPHPLASLG